MKASASSPDGPDLLRPLLGLERKLSLPYIATEGVESFDVSEHDTYTDEEPTRSICGHQTEQMQQHYSTVNGGERRDALAGVISLFGPSVGRVGRRTPLLVGRNQKRPAEKKLGWMCRGKGRFERILEREKGFEVYRE